MTRAKLDGLWLLLLGSSVVVLLLAFLLTTHSPIPMGDFKSSYYAARCLIRHVDPYREGEVMRVYQAEGADLPFKSAMDRLPATRYVYPPTTFVFTAPFALLPWGPARILWMMLTVGGLLFAAILAWSLGAEYAPILSGALIGYLLANSEVLLVLGNPSGIVIGLSVVAAWCFLRDRYIPAGILSLAVALAVKPQDAAFVWLYFLLAGGVHRKRALQTLLATVLLSLPVVLWVWQVSPHWFQELHSNVAAFAVHGGLNDPGRSSPHANSLVDLQVAISFFRDDPRIYNPISYLFCAPLMIIWAFVTLRSPSFPAKAWLALAAIAPLTMLPVHHHLYDTKLLLLTVPACALLWSGKGSVAWLALAVNLAVFVATGDVSWTVLYRFIDNLHPSALGLPAWTLPAMQALPVPLLLLLMSIFYLWIYARRASAKAQSQPSPAAR